MQKRAFVTGTLGSFANRRASNYFLDQVAFVINVDVRLVRRAEKIVVITHDLLIGAHEHEGEIVRLALDQRVKLEHVLDIVEVNKLIDDAVGVAGDIAERGVLAGWFVQPMNRDNREQLVERPVIRN